MHHASAYNAAEGGLRAAAQVPPPGRGALGALPSALCDFPASDPISFRTPRTAACHRAIHAASKSRMNRMAGRRSTEAPGAAFPWSRFLALLNSDFLGHIVKTQVTTRQLNNSRWSAHPANPR